MIISRIIGGLGNQMFQYAIGRSMASFLNTKLKLDIEKFETYELHKYLLNKFKIIEDFATKEEIQAFTKKKTKIQALLNKLSIVKYENQVFSEKRQFHFDHKVFRLRGNIYLAGYWQSDKYFRNIEDTIRKEFSLKNPPEGKNREFLSKIENCNSVALHVRRGDFVSDSNTSKKHGVCSLEYYYDSIKLMNEKVKNPTFFIFSDDSEWVKGNLEIPNNEKYFIAHNSVDEACEDLRLMRNCNHFITANSTFSWWGAWLSKNPKKIIITPRKWLSIDKIRVTDLIPDEWLRL